MIFTPANCQAILEGKKTQTRRPWKPGDRLALEGHAVFGALGDGRGRLKWCTFKTYALQPGRGKKGIARIRFTHFELQYLQDITEEDAIAEGIRCLEFPTLANRYYAPGDIMADAVTGIYHIPYRVYTAIEAYHIQWDRLYKHRPELQWKQNPRVWVLDLELA